MDRGLAGTPESDSQVFCPQLVYGLLLYLCVVHIHSHLNCADNKKSGEVW